MSTPPRQTLFSFSMDIDDALWVNRWDGASWWAGMGTPPGTTGCYLAGSAETAVGGPLLQVLVTATDGHLWSRTWDGTTWAWVDAGPLPVTGIGGWGAGQQAAVGIDGRLYAVLGGFTTSTLWAVAWDGTSWTWTDLGSPSGGGVHRPVGCAVTDTGLSTSIEVVVVGGDRHLWVRSWDGAAGGAWTDQGVPAPTGAGDGVGVVSVNDPSMAYAAFVRGGDGLLWAWSMSHGVGTWTSFGGSPTSPPDVIIGAGCALDVDAQGAPVPTAFVESGGRLWMCRLAAGSGTWTDLGAPPSSAVNNGGGLGAGSAVTANNEFYLFATVWDVPGHLWLCRRLGGVWSWTDLGPQGRDAGGGWGSLVYSVG